MNTNSDRLDNISLHTLGLATGTDYAQLLRDGKDKAEVTSLALIALLDHPYHRDFIADELEQGHYAVSVPITTNGGKVSVATHFLDHEYVCYPVNNKVRTFCSARSSESGNATFSIGEFTDETNLLPGGYGITTSKIEARFHFLFHKGAYYSILSDIDTVLEVAAEKCREEKIAKIQSIASRLTAFWPITNDEVDTILSILKATEEHKDQQDEEGERSEHAAHRAGLL